MTTHDEQTKTVKTSTEDDAAASRPESSEEMEPSTARTDPSADAPPTHGEALTTGDEPSTARTEPSQMRTEPSSEPSDARSLFADEDLSGLRSRWDDVQAAFVDSPKDCVQKADTLVAEVVEQLTTGFSEARARLEAQWARGEKVSTEDLRLALKRYRDFFQRLLSV
jgi:hypothetical protein